VGESTILSRTGGAPTLAVGMAHILSAFIGGKALMGFWYHFAILFEALFILTTLDAGTRVARFMVQDLLGSIAAPLGRTTSLAGNLLATSLCVAGWGYFLYQGVVDPLGGINTLWPLFGISNQMLAAIALTLGTVLLVKAGKARYAWVTAAPLLWLLVCTLTAAAQKLWHPDPKIGFLAHADIISKALDEGRIVGPATSVAQMEQLLFNDRIDAALCALFAVVVIAVAAFGLRAVLGSSVAATQEARA
jgi:carbon starvation protein